MVERAEYRISRANRREARWLRIGGLVTLILAGFLLYRLGADHRASDYTALVADFIVADQEVNRLSERSIKLNHSNAALQQQHEIDVSALKKITEELRSLRGQYTEVRKELELYTRLAEHDFEDAGVVVHRFDLSKTGSAGHYRYHLVLARSLTETGSLVGDVEIVMGVGDAAHQVGSHDIEFRIYGSFEGLIVPQAADTEISIKVSADNGVGLSKQYLWRELLDRKLGDEEAK